MSEPLTEAEVATMEKWCLNGSVVPGGAANAFYGLIAAWRELTKENERLQQSVAELIASNYAANCKDAEQAAEIANLKQALIASGNGWKSATNEIAELKATIERLRKFAC